MDYYKKMAFYIIFIFITICIVGNYIIYVSPNFAVNSLYFTDVSESIYNEKQVSVDSRIKEKIEQSITFLREGKCEEFFYLLTDECKAKYNNSVSDFTNVVTKKYFAEKTNYFVQYMGYNDEEKYYLFEINIQLNPYLSDEERKMEVYTARKVYLKVYLSENQSYSIDFDV